MGPYSLEPNERYMSQDSAAFAALFDLLPRSIKEQIEYGGMIYRNNDNSYSYTPPIKGEYDTVDPGGPATCPADTKAVAYYHTHGSTDRDYLFEEWFGLRDRQYARNYGIDGYLATPTGAFKIFGFPTRTLGRIPTR